jgi:hypothetical protein
LALVATTDDEMALFDLDVITNDLTRTLLQLVVVAVVSWMFKRVCDIYHMFQQLLIVIRKLEQAIDYNNAHRDRPNHYFPIWHNANDKDDDSPPSG